MICGSFREIQLGAILLYAWWFLTFMSTPIWGRKLDVCEKMGGNPQRFSQKACNANLAVSARSTGVSRTRILIQPFRMKRQGFACLNNTSQSITKKSPSPKFKLGFHSSQARLINLSFLWNSQSSSSSKWWFQIAFLFLPRSFGEMITYIHWLLCSIGLVQAPG